MILSSTSTGSNSLVISNSKLEDSQLVKDLFLLDNKMLTQHDTRAKSERKFRQRATSTVLIAYDDDNESLT